MSWRVIRALLLKYAFICSRNTFRAMDVFFWPTLDLLMWGFVTLYMIKIGKTAPSLVLFLIGGLILWNVLWRAQHVISVAFLDDVWSRNLLNLFTAPIKPLEYVGASYIMGFVQSLIVVVLLSIIAATCYGFNILELGTPLFFLYVNLLFMGWWLGLLVTGFILRWGPPAEALAWAVPVLIQPVSAVFYPVSVLPKWLQVIAQCLPSAHVFEGMRQLLDHHQIDQYHIWCAVLLNIFYMIVSAYTFNFFFEQARRRGFLAKYAS